MDEIIESLKSFDCQSKIDARNKLKDLLIKMATLTMKLNKQKSKWVLILESVMLRC